jgi:hypothetical protein
MSMWWIPAIALFAIPVVTVFIARAHVERKAWEAALDVPCVVALDLLSVLVLARVFTLEIATLVSRGLWLAGGAFVIARRRREIAAWWRAIALDDWAMPALAAACAVWLSTRVSLTCALWDRYWHIPLASAMNGQHTPFSNVYEQGRPLYYHYAGDVAGAMMQALSFGHQHTSAALSRVHDVLFAYFAAVVCALAREFGATRRLSGFAVAVASLLAGPATLLMTGLTRPWKGHSITNLFSLSFRPHVALSYLLVMGFVVGLVLPVLKGDAGVRNRTRPVVFACAAALVLVDETSLGLLGLFCASVWLTAPDALASTRWRGVGFGFGLLAVIAATIVCFGGTFQPGAPSQTLRLVDFRAPGFESAPIPLTSSAGRRALMLDWFAAILTLFAGLLRLAIVPRRSTGTLWFGYLVISAAGALAFTRLEINGAGEECHRFATLPLLLSPLFVSHFASRTPAALRTELGLVSGLGVAGPGIAMVSTLEWVVTLAPHVCTSFGLNNYDDIDCRRDMAARLGDKPIVAYVDKELWYDFAGCRPLNAPSSQVNMGGHQIFTGWPAYGVRAIEPLRKFQSRAEPLPVFCGRESSDPVCRMAAKESRCTPEGKLMTRCSLPPKP